MNKFGNNGLHRLKGRMNGPGKDETIGVGSTDKDIAEQKQKMLDLVAKNKKKYEQQHGPIQNKQQPMLDADRLNDPNYGKDSFLTKLKTVVSNPFDSLTAVMGTNPAMTSLRQVRQLHEAKDRDDKDAKQVLARSSGFNLASSFIPAAATADAVVSTIKGDPTALVTKKLNKIKPIAKGLQKLNLDPKKATKVIATGVKAARKL